MKLGIPLANRTFTQMLALKKCHVRCTAIVRSCDGKIIPSTPAIMVRVMEMAEEGTPFSTLHRPSEGT